MLHPTKIRMTFGWIRAGDAPKKCRNCLIRDKTGKRSPAATCSRVKYTAPSPSPIVDSTRPSVNSISVLSRIWQ